MLKIASLYQTYLPASLDHYFLLELNQEIEALCWYIFAIEITNLKFASIIFSLTWLDHSSLARFETFISLIVINVESIISLNFEMISLVFFWERFHFLLFFLVRFLSQFLYCPFLLYSLSNSSFDILLRRYIW